MLHPYVLKHHRPDSDMVFITLPSKDAHILKSAPGVRYAMTHDWESPSGIEMVPVDLDIRYEPLTEAVDLLRKFLDDYYKADEDIEIGDTSAFDDFLSDLDK